MQFFSVLFAITALLAAVVSAAPAEAGKSNCGHVCFPKDHKCPSGLHLKGFNNNQCYRCCH
ncbi:hypothetical protein ETB97_009060 [Aspergillus alliaceus]|uniref:Uncharacterized protein n=1 Tax=Petromyces alliaceus TaxID=209559 RepID=A0A8H6ADN0_PETAA|nr:hypothetical protein ETB97_009060 [Aspergillus burnettii]